jgi:hypothetical protein
LSLKFKFFCRSFSSWQNASFEAVLLYMVRTLRGHSQITIIWMIIYQSDPASHYEFLYLPCYIFRGSSWSFPKEEVWRCNLSLPTLHFLDMVLLAIRQTSVPPCTPPSRISLIRAELLRVFDIVLLPVTSLHITCYTSYIIYDLNDCYLIIAKV